MARRRVSVEEPRQSAEGRTQDMFEAKPQPASSVDEAGYRVTHTTEPGTEQSIRRRRPAGTLEAKGDEPACHQCGARLSVTNVGAFYPCGHGPAHEPPMQKGWRKNPSPGTESGHGASARVNAQGEVLYCSVCRLAQFDAPNGAGPTCTKGHGGAEGVTAAQLRAKESIDIKQDFKDHNPVVTSQLTTPEKIEKLVTSERQVGPMNGALAGQTVTVVWGKELYSPKQFHTYEVGPFTATTTVIPGETFERAAERAMEDLRRFADAERERKRAAYLKAVGA